MILSLIFLILIFAVTLKQATQGLFSALIMAVLTILCAGMSVGLHEWIGAELVAQYWKPDYAHAIALGVPFGVVLLLLRAVFDKLIRRACLLPAWIDRIGGGTCGLVTALVMVGVMAASVQMVPFGPSIIGFARVPSAVRAEGGAPISTALEEQRNLWFSPDRFAIAVAGMLSDGIFSGERSFTGDNPDLMQTVGWVQSAPPGVSRFAPAKSVSVIGTELVKEVFQFTAGDDRSGVPATYEAVNPKAGMDLRMVRLQIQNSARDVNKSIIFTPRQIHISGKTPDGATRQYFPIAIQQADASQPVNRHISLRKARGAFVSIVDDPMSPREGDNKIELVFEVPKGFEPSLVEYKRGGRSVITLSSTGADRAAPQSPPESGGSATPAPPPSEPGAAPLQRRPRPGDESGGETGRGGNVRGATAQGGRSFFGEQLPMPMKAYRKLANSEVNRGALIGGHLAGEVDKQATGSESEVTKFEVPSDKRLLHLDVQKLQARSGLGRALTAAVALSQRYTVEGANGTLYDVVGKYAVADVGGTRVVEVQYYTNEGDSVGRIGPFERIKESHLQGDYQFVLLFLVDPGVQITAFSTGGDASRRDDLIGENLVAPR